MPIPSPLGIIAGDSRTSLSKDNTGEKIVFGIAVTDVYPDGFYKAKAR